MIWWVDFLFFRVPTQRHQRAKHIRNPTPHSLGVTHMYVVQAARSAGQLLCSTLSAPLNAAQSVRWSSPWQQLGLRFNKACKEATLVMYSGANHVLPSDPLIICIFFSHTSTSSLAKSINHLPATSNLCILSTSQPWCYSDVFWLMLFEVPQCCSPLDSSGGCITSIVKTEPE